MQRYALYNWCPTFHGPEPNKTTEAPQAARELPSQAGLNPTKLDRSVLGVRHSAPGLWGQSPLWVERKAPDAEEPIDGHCTHGAALPQRA